MYQYPAVNSTTQLFQYINVNLVNGLFGIGILLLIFTVLFIRLSVAKSKYAFLTACFVTTVTAIILWGLGLILDGVLIICVILSVISLIGVFTED